ncbi:Hypothetical_protein [Hexamita inflata]|uniref:Hypothetical_protein n=1 Tax=Hexamita inflata TaxID=28002 RepID=A0ABP1K2D0_9EUKA
MRAIQCSRYEASCSDILHTSCGVYEALIPTDQFQEEYIILFQSVRKDQEIYANQKQGLICTKKFEVGDTTATSRQIYAAIDELKIAGRTPNLDVKHQISQTGRSSNYVFHGMQSVGLDCRPRTFRKQQV